ncbi:MAG: acetyl-CoA carboxylase biotin carboxyl carrier protein [Acidobacteria bacterium]|nr:acetyl-CoA carboxylase biotin carboxyl carrier protein [Acidobacteriota bacterium]
MYKYEEICELIQLVGSTGVASVEIEHAGSRVRIEGAPSRIVAMEAPAPVLASAAVLAETPVSAAGSGVETGAVSGEEEELHYVTSPIVGTFYRAPNPDADPYIKVGEFVEQGKTLCIVEAMKLMNEIECDVSGTIVKVLPENSQPVEYGEHLFAVRLG